MNNLAASLVANRKVILLTFEIFWIVIFVLHAAASSSGVQVAQFVYANF